MQFLVHLKLHYINSNLATNQQYSTSIHAVIGTLPILRHPSPVIWRQASCYLFEDVLTAQTIQMIYQLGPGYLGSFQSPPIGKFKVLSWNQIKENNLELCN